MTRLLPVLTIVLIAVAARVRTESVTPSTPRVMRPTSDSVQSTSDPRVELQAAPAKVEPVALTTTAAAPRPTPAAAPAFGSWALLGLLDRTLSLTELQKRQAEEILRERNRKVDEYGVEVARRGWAQLKDFDLRIESIRDEAQRRLAAILDSGQAAQFGRLAAAGSLNDHLSIEVPDGLVVLD